MVISCCWWLQLVFGGFRWLAIGCWWWLYLVLVGLGGYRVLLVAIPGYWWV